MERGVEDRCRSESELRHPQSRAAHQAYVD